MYIQTKTGKKFSVGWAGVASIDGALRFTLLNVTPAVAFSVFTKPSECESLTFDTDGITETHEKFVSFKSIDVNSDGSIIVALGKE